MSHYTKKFLEKSGARVRPKGIAIPKNSWKTSETHLTFHGKTERSRNGSIMPENSWQRLFDASKKVLVDLRDLLLGAICRKIHEKKRKTRFPYWSMKSHSPWDLSFDYTRKLLENIFQRVGESYRHGGRYVLCQPAEKTPGLFLTPSNNVWVGCRSLISSQLLDLSISVRNSNALENLIGIIVAFPLIIPKNSWKTWWTAVHHWADLPPSIILRKRGYRDKYLFLYGFW